MTTAEHLTEIDNLAKHLADCETDKHRMLAWETIRSVYRDRITQFYINREPIK